MNTTKVQTDYLKRLIKGEPTLFCSGIEGKIGLSDTKAVFLIPTEQMYLDRKDRTYFDLKQHYLLAAFDACVSIEKTDETFKTPDGEAVIFSNDTVQMLILKKYLSYCDKYDRFYAKSPRDPLYVTDEDLQIQAVILPYRSVEFEQKRIKEARNND